MPHLAAEFMRFSAPGPVALARGIAEARIKLATAIQAGEALPCLGT
jgi:hypothetical protein